MGHILLIVDDSATTRAFVRRTIQLAGVAADTVHEAADGQAALDVMRSKPIDLVVADLHMPVMDGAEMVRHMREDAALKLIPVLVVSADPNTSRMQELLQSGVVGYIRKPFTPEMFRVALQQVLEAPMPSMIIDSQHLMEAVGETLEAMAFISLLPAEPPFMQPAEPVLVQMQFRGPACGALELVASLDLGKAIVSGITGDPSQTPSDSQALDAIKELMNVSAGAMLRGENDTDNFDISLPTTPVRLTDTQWIEYVESGRAAVVDAEGSILALGVTLSE